MTVSNTGPVYDPNTRALRMSNTASGYTITVFGDFIVDNFSTFKMNNGTGSCTVNVFGDFLLNSGCYCIVTGGASSTLNVAGNVSVVGGDFIINEDGSFSTASFNIDGNFDFSGGIIRDSGTGPCEINFTGTGVQTYIKTGGSFQNDIDFDVAAGSILDMGTYVIDGGSGDFTLNLGAGIITAHLQGLSNTPGIGSVQLGGTKTFSSAADYTYNGSSAQVTGNAINTTNDLTLNNASGISLTNGITVNGDLNLVSGKVTSGGNVLYLANGAPGSLSYGAGSFIDGFFERAITGISHRLLFSSWCFSETDGLI